MSEALGGLADDDWELEAATYRHEDILGQIRLDDLRDELYGLDRGW